ncbi:MAG: 3-dehydroquinate synthase [Pseudomonadota bacterium]
MAQTLTVDLGERSYDIHIGQSLLEKIDALISLDLSVRKIFILYDQNTYPYAQVIEETLSQKGIQTSLHAEKGGEPTKSYDGYFRVMNWLLDNGVNRDSVLIAVGGGVIGDLGGFAAATAMRGISYVQVPTTLLAQVDSSVGGKTGINSSQGKNLVGAFYQPEAVICDTNTLQTLPERELKAGYAEVVKYGLINDQSFFEWLEENGNSVLSLDQEALIQAIYKSCAAKSDVVAQDEKEKGLRALLNLGHTFGHALEGVAGYDGRLLHGEAVSIGMVMAFDLSSRKGLCAQEEPARVEAHLKSCGLKTQVADITPFLETSTKELWEFMTRDKKASGGNIGFIMVRGIGQSFQTTDVSENEVKALLEEKLAA